MSETLRATLARLRTLTFAEAYASIVAGDPLGLGARVERALLERARWAPHDAVALRCARHLAEALRAAPEAEDQLEGWLTAVLARAIDDARDGSRAAEPREREAWARHYRHAAATLGVDDALGSDAHSLFDSLPEPERRLALQAQTLLRTGRTRELDPASWGHFTDLWRNLIRRVQEVRPR